MREKIKNSSHFNSSFMQSIHPILRRMKKKSLNRIKNLIELISGVNKAMIHNKKLVLKGHKLILRMFFQNLQGKTFHRI